MTEARSVTSGIIIAFAIFFSACDSNSEEEFEVPEFELNDLSGKSFKLADQRGKDVILYFFTTSCPSCRTTSPELELVHKAYSDSGVVVAGISMSNVDTLKAYADTLNLSFPILLDNTGSITQAFGVSRVPSYYLLDKQGDVFGTYIGSSTKKDWDNVLDEMP